MENSVEPIVLEEIAGQSAFVSDAKGWRDGDNWPSAVLLYGRPGRS